MYRSPLHFTATFSQHSLSTVVACCHSTRRSELLHKKHDIQDHRSERCQPQEKRDLLNDHCKGGYHQGAPCKEHLQTNLQIISQASSPSQGLFSSKKEDHKLLLDFKCAEQRTQGSPGKHWVLAVNLDTCWGPFLHLEI